MLVTRRELLSLALQLVAPKPPTNLQVVQQFTCPLGHTTAAWQSSFSSKTLICAQCGVYFHVLPVSQ